MNRRVDPQEIQQGADFAAELNALIEQAIEATGVANDGEIHTADIYDINAHLRRSDEAIALWTELHGDDEDGIETGFHLVQNDGATTHLFGDSNAVNTVADGIYHLGFDFVMEGKQLTTETLEGEVFSQDGIRTLAPGESLSCSISMGAYELPQNRTGSLPAGRYQMNAFYHHGEHWKAYQEKYGMTPVHLNRPVALIDLIDRASRESSDYDLGAMRRRWASREIQEANLRPLHGEAFPDDPSTPLAAIPVIRFAKRQQSMNVSLEIQNVSGAAIRYATGGDERPLRDLELTLSREGDKTPIRAPRDPRDNHSVATLRAYQSIPLSVSLNDYELGGAEGVPLGRYKLHAKYSVDEASAADEGTTPVQFDRAILLIDVVED